MKGRNIKTFKKDYTIISIVLNTVVHNRLHSDNFVDLQNILINAL